MNMDEIKNENGALPADDGCTLHIDNFDGPLHLLWELIRNSKLDITEVSVSHITEQYVGYLKHMQDLNIRIAIEFIRLASDLLYYKSRALLPAGKLEDEYFVPPLPPELIIKLLEFKKYQASSEYLYQKFSDQSNLFIRENRDEELPEQGEYIDVNLFDLLRAFAQVMESRVYVEQEEIVFDEILVSDRIEHIKDILRRQEVVMFTDLFGAKINRLEIVATFLAILELSKTRILKLMQHRIFANIRIIRNFTPDQSS